MLVHLVGPERAQLLGVAPQAGCLGVLVPEVFRAVFRLGERLEDRVQGPLRTFIDLFSQQLMERMVLYFDRYKQRRFAVPGALRAAWDLNVD